MASRTVRILIAGLATVGSFAAAAALSLARAADASVIPPARQAPQPQYQPDQPPGDGEWRDQSYQPWQPWINSTWQPYWRPYVYSTPYTYGYRQNGDEAVTCHWATRKEKWLDEHGKTHWSSRKIEVCE